MTNPKRDSWGKVGKWYDTSVGDRGFYFHEHVVVPNAIKLLNLKQNSRILDIGCGQGVLARAIKPDINYTGVDIAGELIRIAQKRDHNPKHNYLISDVSKPFLAGKNYTHAVSILALQNIKDSRLAIENTALRLVPGGVFVIILNHPMFRIPRQTAWGIDEANKLQYRKVFRYLSPLEIPIKTHPGNSNSPVTWSYHKPLSEYIKNLADAGFLIQLIEEWASDKKSRGSASRMENHARNEIPLFMAIKAINRPISEN